VSTAPLCDRDAATRGAEYEAGRHGGGAEFEGGERRRFFSPPKPTKPR
jgi:hypothetical protein